MSSRALRKVQKQRELARQEAEQENTSDQECEDSKPLTSKFNAFDLLDADDEVSEGEEAHIEDDPEPVPSPKPTANRKKKKQKKKKATKRDITSADTPVHAASDGQGLDDIDRALKELSVHKIEDGGHAGAPPNEADESEALCALLAVDTKRLNAMNEMRKLFGNVAVEDRDGGESPGRRRERNREMVDLGRALTGRFSPASRGQVLSGMALRKNVLMQGKDEWPRMTSGGLGMEIVAKRPSGVTEFKLVHNSHYQDVQRQFDMCVQSMEPERMIEHLQFNPYHISTLLQVSEIAKHQGDHAVSGDLLERALFNIGRSVQSSFGTCLKEGKARLNFTLKENRELWLATWRYVINLGMKGTWKTTYEWAKFLLSLDTDDPYCLNLTIDQIAIKAREHEHFLELCSHPIFKERWDSFPNIQCSLSLAYVLKGNATGARDQLRKAVSRYPWIFCRLAQELNISPVPRSIWGATAPNSAFELFAELYIKRAKDIWNTPETISLLVEVADSVDATQPAMLAPEISLNIARHVLVSDIPAVLTHLPREFTAGQISASDPLPPGQPLGQEDVPSSWLFNVIRGVINANAIPENAHSDGESSLDSGEVIVTHDHWLFNKGLFDVAWFIEENGVDPGNWDMDRDITPIAAWVRRLMKDVPPDEWNQTLHERAAEAMVKVLQDQAIPIVTDLLKEELLRQSEEQ
ncbi:hypothetical protein LOZ12_002108 [Ophidiomyces ophidiicola]|uniref:uncharacterized protein n=1 Tax=Ophidiomyces ophidiicola TaxID=1387563 RepID=UPI0020C44FBD|nr:uncharacterized protein LOZ57_002186 [Ophidiomyces ophidiicola]KAI1948009.1 hypothetical protein LOZ62_002869 [Ophidiomyces ophidiicola]KAI1949711.1 hypothetical protein LOZ57_002186 [Ophidiomyces ophidiicola]KAI1961627.1 hypothetical protein LOZ59_002431 [Ophidiomyces ophidiicola]KAI1974215.1 hypothetical protein LOZ56_001418 [Ophidiomyces ophidiicola]KAI2028567.1 hypothetical protein LOZ45_002134 [Ophidiomyces ophidiicola]